MVTSGLSLIQREAADSYSVLELAAPSDRRIARASIHGPFCQYSRTLSTRFDFTVNAQGVGARCTIVDPCYWTPALPFLYDLEIHWRSTDGRAQTAQMSIGLRRLAARESSFFWEGRRIVLRGTHAASLNPEQIADARRNDLTLVATSVPEEFHDLTDRHGIPLVADLRDTTPDLDMQRLVGLSRRPSVVALLIDRMQLEPCDVQQIPPNCFIAVAVYPQDELAARRSPTRIDAVAVMIDPAHRPPRELAACGKPLIAIELGKSPNDLTAARAGCEQLQARLAPEFNLAGYFVGMPDV